MFCQESVELGLLLLLSFISSGSRAAITSPSLGFGSIPALEKANSTEHRGKARVSSLGHFSLGLRKIGSYS